jgi:Peptidase family M23
MLKLVPGQLFFSRLPGGELEFSCILVAPAAPAGSALSWTLRPANGGGGALTYERPVHDNELSRGRVVLSAVLPPGWPDSILTVDVAEAHAERDVRAYRQEQRFGLPFDSDVFVVGGHRIGEPHRLAVDVPAQQFGWDLLPLRPDDLAVFNHGMSDPLRSTDFACFGQPVLSPGPGIVAKVVDGAADAGILGAERKPARPGIDWAFGNHVIIEHAHQVYSCLAHLKAGSVSVKPGQEVAVGTPVGAVGSSGNITGPHLHLHFMNGPNAVTAVALPVELTAEGETVAPVAGQIIGP